MSEVESSVALSEIENEGARLTGNLGKVIKYLVEQQQKNKHSTNEKISRLLDEKSKLDEQIRILQESKARQEILIEEIAELEKQSMDEANRLDNEIKFNLQKMALVKEFAKIENTLLVCYSPLYHLAYAQYMEGNGLGDLITDKLVSASKLPTHGLSFRESL
jgi:hypothetical protein